MLPFIVSIHKRINTKIGLFTPLLLEPNFVNMVSYKLNTTLNVWIKICSIYRNNSAAKYNFLFKNKFYKNNKTKTNLQAKNKFRVGCSKAIKV